MLFSLPLLATLATLTTPLLASAPETISGFNLVWSETFSSNTIDTSVWNIDTAAPSNNEQERYTTSPQNCQLTGNSLIITPLNNGGSWTSCRLESQPSFQTRAGGIQVVQARLKLGTPGAQLQGIWPAFWSLGESIRNGVGWPQCGEIDTFENVNGGALGYGTVHCGAHCNDPTGLSSGINFNYGDFHTWAHAIDLTSGDWTQQSITWYMDGQAYKVVHGRDVGDQASWAALAQSAMYIILNVAVGGSWPGAVGGNTASGTASGMEVLYVGVYHNY